MAKIKPMELIAQMSGKVCSHSDTYFVMKNGTQFTGKICNPYTGEPTEAQLAVQNKFAQAQEAIKALDDEQMNAYRTAFKKQKKYKTLRGYIFAQEYDKLNVNG